MPRPPDGDGPPPGPIVRHFVGGRRVTADDPSQQRFVFATGLECSYPTIRGPDGARLRVDELRSTRHDERWREDFALTRELGIDWLRYGVPWFRVHRAADRFDWSWLDEKLAALRDAGITPILDLCHFGVPDWLGDFQNPDLPRAFARYARAVAERYPWVRYYTPVNEMYLCAEFSAYLGMWNERLRSHRGFVTAIHNVARMTAEAIAAITAVRADALFILCESSQTNVAAGPDLIADARFYDERSFIALDLVCGHPVDAGIYRYLRDHGVDEDAYLWFLEHARTDNLVIGHDYYAKNVHLVEAPGRRPAASEAFSYYTIGQRYARRYDLPVMHTETNAVHDAEDWLWRTWTNIRELRRDSVPICGMTWYSLTHQIDWDTALVEPNGRVYPVGLVDLDRRITPVGRAYRDLIATWRDTPLLPSGPLTIAGLGGAAVREPDIIDEEASA